MVLKVDYKVKKDIKACPIQCNADCLDTAPLYEFCDNIEDYIVVAERDNGKIAFAESSRLLEIMRTISEELAYG